ncbi:MAG: hypothetical protein K9M99_00810 [Candidatus Cloacimonetes bacterium]|nr:hypothetical protein [Candidatus Cloacimonadota bacterium]
MRFEFGKLNTVLMVIAILVTAIGYIIMGTGDNTISPVMLVIAYAILFPAAIITGVDRSSSEEDKGKRMK